MSMIAKLAGIAHQDTIPQDAAYVKGINKIASEAIGAIVDHYREDSEMSKQAEESIEKLSAEDQQELVGLVRYGQGMARGEYIGKQAGYREGTTDMFNVITKIAEAEFGAEFAVKLATAAMDAAGVTQEDLEEEDSKEQIKSDIINAASEQLIEAAGGEDNITPEQAEELAEIAETAGEIGLQQLSEGEENAEQE